MSPPLLEIMNLSLRCNLKLILDTVCLSVQENEIVALVGESGSGKSMLARSIMRLFPSPEINILAGKIIFNGTDLLKISEKELRKLRGKLMGYIPQFPLSALNPIMKIGQQLSEAYFPPEEGGASAEERALSLLRRVGFPNPKTVMTSLPHQLSGGMRQRVLIAMALMNAPKFLIADEPTSALDVTLQAEFLELLQDLKNEYGLAILLITHDLGIVAKAADSVVILDQGKTVESGTTEDIFYNPQAPYTKVLLDALLPHPAQTRECSHD